MLKTKKLKESVLETEKESVKNALIESMFNVPKAAKILGVSRRTIYNKISFLDIDINEMKLRAVKKLMS